jgi:acetolactate synthase-1/3 small subunit
MMANGDNLERHTIIALVEDRPGVLNRIASKWRQRAFNIESLAVGHSEKAGLSRMTFVVDASTDADQVVKQLDKLVDVVDIRDISDEDIVSREMVMIKVRADKSNRGQIIEIADLFQAEIVDVAPDSVIIEATGREMSIDSLVQVLEDFEIIELVRTGRVAMLRGSEVSHPRLHEEPERYQGYEPPYSSK